MHRQNELLSWWRFNCDFGKCYNSETFFFLKWHISYNSTICVALYIVFNPAVIIHHLITLNCLHAAPTACYSNYSHLTLHILQIRPCRHKNQIKQIWSQMKSDRIETCFILSGKSCYFDQAWKVDLNRVQLKYDFFPNFCNWII